MLGREEEHVLRREIRAVTLSSWIFMVMIYLVLQEGSLFITAAQSDIAFEYSITIKIFPIVGFTVFKRILSLLFWCCDPAQSGSTNRCSIRPRALLRRLCHDILFTLLSFMILAAFIYCEIIQNSFNPRYHSNILSKIFVY